MNWRSSIIILSIHTQKKTGERKISVKKRMPWLIKYSQRIKKKFFLLLAFFFSPVLQLNWRKYVFVFFYSWLLLSISCERMRSRKWKENRLTLNVIYLSSHWMVTWGLSFFFLFIRKKQNKEEKHERPKWRQEYWFVCIWFLNKLIEKKFNFFVSRIDSGVITRQDIDEKLIDEIQRMKNDLKSKDNEIEKAYQLKIDTDREIEDLTASLFQSAHDMVEQAKQAQANVEDKLKHSNQTVRKNSTICFLNFSSFELDQCFNTWKYSIEKNCQWTKANSQFMSFIINDADKSIECKNKIDFYVHFNKRICSSRLTIFYFESLLVGNKNHRLIKINPYLCTESTMKTFYLVWHFLILKYNNSFIEIFT